MWSGYLTIVETVAMLPGVKIVEGHHCEFGQGSTDRLGEWGPVKKATGWMTNSLRVAEEVGVLCKGGHVHVPLMGGCAKATERYPVNLVKAIFRGICDELKIGSGIHALEVGATIEEPETMEQITGEEFEIFTDNISGTNLPAEKVRAGRREEMGYMEQLEVYGRIPFSECWEKAQRPPIPTGWVDVNKGDEQRPDVRCRLVVKETKRLTTLGPEDAASVFAGTPPLEGLRLLISLAMSGDQTGPDDNVIVFLEYLARAPALGYPMGYLRQGTAGRRRVRPGHVLEAAEGDVRLEGRRSGFRQEG